jgi:cytochrome c oxidase cbb3-type subunit 1
MFLTGMLIMAWNVIKTVAGGSAYEAPIPAGAPAHA